jgi:hypothetical protein
MAGGCTLVNISTLKVVDSHVLRTFTVKIQAFPNQAYILLNEARPREPWPRKSAKTCLLYHGRRIHYPLK